MKILKILVIFLLLSTVYPIPIVIPDSPSDVWMPFSIYSVVKQIDSNTYTMLIYSGPVNYNDSGTLKPINTSFELLPTDHIAYQYGYRAYNDKGIFSVFLKPNIQSNWTVAFAYNRSNNPTQYVLRSDLVGIGYIDPSQNYSYHLLQTPQSSVGSIDNSTATYSNAFNGVDIRWTYDNAKLKEEIELSNTSKTLLQNNPPSSFGLSNKDSFFAVVTRLDFGKLNITDGEVNYTGDFSFNKSRLYFKNAKGKVLFALPMGFVFEKYNISNAKNLVFRFKKIGDYYYLFSGVKVTTLNSMSFPVVFDPTLDADPGASGNDGFVFGTSASYSTARNTGSSVNNDATAMNLGQAWNAFLSKYYVYRSFLKFDTSSIPSTATITNAYLKLYGSYDASDTDFTIRLQKWTGDTPIDTGDFTQYDGTNYDAGNFSTSSFTTSGYNTIYISNYGLITKAGYTKICLRSSREISSTVPTGNEYVGVRTYDAGSSYYPILHVEYSTADTTPPSPDPLTWATEPYETSSSSISMVATTASDDTPPIYYYFDETTGHTGGSDSGWQTSTTYSDTGLSENTQYGYRVKAKDSAAAPNEGSYSSISYEYTDIDPPTSDEFDLGTELTSSSIKMEINPLPPNYNAGSTGVYFDFVSGGTGGDDRAFSNVYNYNDTGLQENTQYTYRAKFRNGDGNDDNEYCASESIYTLVDPPLDAEFTIDNYGLTWINMSVAVPPNYNAGSTGCYFAGVTGTPPDSGWITGSTNYTGSRWYYNCTGLSPGTTYGFKVKYRNGDATETTYTSEKTQTTASEFIWIDITNDTWALGNVIMGSSIYTNETGETFIADMDNTTVNTDLKLQITNDAAVWSAATSGNSPGIDIYRLNASVDTWATEYQIVTASATTISTNIPAGQNETFDLRFDAPTSTSTGDQQSITVTATLVKS